MTREPDKNKFTKSERALLRELAEEAWNAELNEALLALYEEFGKWADDAISSFELSDRIHQFHDGTARELYGRYTNFDSAGAVARAVALGLVGQESVGEVLLRKLASGIEFFQKGRG